MRLLRRVSQQEASQRAGGRELPDVSGIVDDVRRNGDVAVARCARRFGDPPPRRVAEEEILAARAAAAAHVVEALEDAAVRIEAFARAQRAAMSDASVETPWGTVGHRIVPVRSAGAYVPAGRYPLPSSLLMTVIPARVAGVERIVVVCPRASEPILAAAAIAGAGTVIEIGGAHAIAALAFGTETIERVDVIAGPGNAFVAAAKRAVYGTCGIDGIAGPSEVLVIASDDADPTFVAADLLAQAEHDPDARPLLSRRATTLPRASIASFAYNWRTFRRVTSPWRRYRAMVGAASLHWKTRRAFPMRSLRSISNCMGPGARALREVVRAYGALFEGEGAAEALGDYGAGPNHVLPTGGTARFSSGLSVATFLTFRTFQRVDRPARAPLRSSAILARCEGLEGHARALEIRGAARAPSASRVD